MLETKQQGENPQAQINEEEIGNLPEKQFRVMIVKLIQDLGNRMEAQIEKIQEMVNKDLEELKNKQSVIVQDTVPQETSQLHVIPNNENLPEISISTPRPSFTQQPAS